MKMRPDCGKIALAIVFPNVGGLVSARITRDNLDPWYKGLKKPSFNPPNSVFGPVWTALYCGMGYASYLVIRDGGGLCTDKNRLALALYGSQLALNWAWSPLFFQFHNFKWSLIDLTVLTGVAAACGMEFYRINKKAGLIFVPYVAWLAFASVLNYSIWKLNDNEERME